MGQGLTGFCLVYLKGSKMENRVLRLKSNAEGEFCIPEWNCVEKDGIIFYRKPLFVNKVKWEKFLDLRASIVSKTNKSGACLVFATSAGLCYNKSIKKVFWTDKWDEKGCSVMYGNGERYMLSSVFAMDDE